MLNVKKYVGFQILADPGSMNSPLGREAYEPSLVDSVGAYLGKSMIGMAVAMTARKKNSSVACRKSIQRGHLVSGGVSSSRRIPFFKLLL
jgi:hypothetical protein